MFRSRLARDKWEYLKGRGYTETGRCCKGISFWKGNARGHITWWGSVSWESVDE